MLIGELADRSGVTAKTLRFYEREGLVPEPDRTSGGYRDYEPAAIERVTFIKDAQAAGLTLAQIGEVLAIRDGGQPPCEHVATLVKRRLADVERRLRELRQVRTRLREIAARAAGYDPGGCDGYCGLLTDP